MTWRAVKDSRDSLITDHALLRYMERVVGVKIAEFERLMWKAIDESTDMGDGFLIGPDGEYYITGERGAIVTVLPPGAGARERKRVLYLKGKGKR